MCLSTAFKGSLDGEKICEYISEIKVGENSVTLVDVMGKEVTVQGAIKSMDFVSSKVVIG